MCVQKYKRGDRASEVAGFLSICAGFAMLDLGLVHIASAGAPCALLLRCRGDWALVISMDTLSLVAPPFLGGRDGFVAVTLLQLSRALWTILGLLNLDLLRTVPVAYRGALAPAFKT